MSIIFEPCPENDFKDFIETYYTECKRDIPKIEAIAGKWTFEDLIPGMSDFDTRFICSNSMTVDDWCAMSTAVGEIHLDLCKRFPKWIRILEHLPGINLTWDEYTDDFTYYPEYRQWSIYRCSNEKELERSNMEFSRKPWCEKDEYFHLKKFISYYGPYIRGIDPAINLGAFESKYPLHSRMMHYFTPPVQSAVSIVLKRTIRGKLESLRMAKEVFLEPEVTTVIDEIFYALGKHYEVPELYEEPELSALEGRLFKALQIVKGILRDYITLVPKESKDNIEDWKKELASVPIQPQLLIFDSSRFCRLMKGRLRFYANAPEYFDSIWLIQNELKRIGNMFYRTPYKVFWKLYSGEEVENIDAIIPKLVPDILTPPEAEATLEFSRLTPGTWEEGKEVEIALAIAGVFDEFFRGLNKIITRVREI
ncbi:MAG: hypothetical protein HPY74_00325 [Firmicutes bacterium]|nr:hypothetical protein [Bacillota bacterium]